uniref:Uncharacterized protein n=1 Tax=Brassica oleracea TaxID=3712 RepID=A0A3P6BUH0_BRAOL|nr:unnamed protein product [Brassica oleracea]
MSFQVDQMGLSWFQGSVTTTEESQSMSQMSRLCTAALFF